jgi:hypothetical protein
VLYFAIRAAISALPEKQQSRPAHIALARPDSGSGRSLAGAALPVAQNGATESSRLPLGGFGVVYPAFAPVVSVTFSGRRTRRRELNANCIFSMDSTV